MTISSWVQFILYFALLLVLTKPLGLYMAHVYKNEKTFLDPVLNPLENLFYRLASVDNKQDMDWKTYAFAMLIFNAAGLVIVYALQRLQGFLPFNPQEFAAVSPDSSFNTAVSFVTNTNWQGYAGESTMSYLTQMLGFTVQNFVSAASGMAVLAAVIRGIVHHTTRGIGNFWVDITRSVIHILLPLSVILTLILVSQGVIQTLNPYQPATMLQPGTDSNGNPVTRQMIAVGPVASQVAIKQLGTNGGGFFNVNSAHPFENPTPLSDLLEMLAILAIPAGLCYTFGVMVGDTRQGWAILTVISILLIALTFVPLWAEQNGNPAFTKLGIDQKQSNTNPGGNMEGKEVRFGIVNSVIWASVTTAASNGSVNSMHDSFMPLAGMIPMGLIQLGEIIFGGVGSGLYGMLAFIIVAVFVAGLMVGRTPEYLGKKIEIFEMKMASIIILLPVIIILIGTAVAVMTRAGTAGILNPGPHGFSEVLYAFSSAGNNNGSAFAGLSTNTMFYNLSLGFIMLVARYWLAIPALAIGGSLARKKKVPVSAGTLPTHTPLFIAWVIAIIIVVGSLSFLPALALGPIVEHLLVFGH